MDDFQRWATFMTYVSILAAVGAGTPIGWRWMNSRIGVRQAEEVAAAVTALLGAPGSDDDEVGAGRFRRWMFGDETKAVFALTILTWKSPTLDASIGFSRATEFAPFGNIWNKEKEVKLGLFRDPVKDVIETISKLSD